MKLTIETPDFNVFDFNSICEVVAEAYGWEDGYTVTGNKVEFVMDNVPCVGEMDGYTFEYREIVDNAAFPGGVFDWISDIGASYMVKAKDEDGKDVFLAVGR